MTDKKRAPTIMGRPMNERPSGPGTAMANFLIEELPTLDMTNQEIADQLGYARPNIVSMWKAGRTKVTVDHILALSEMTGVDATYILALYLDQYVSEWAGVDRFKELATMVNRLCTEEEYEIIRTVREARRYNSKPLTDEQREGLAKLFAEPITTPEGPYKPLSTVDEIPRTAERRKFARRGHHRDLSISEIEELEATRAAEAEKPVRKRGKKATAMAEAKEVEPPAPETAEAGESETLQTA